VARRLSLTLLGFVGALVLVAVTIYLVTLPDGTRSVSARAQGASSVDVSYIPGKPDARIGLRLEGFSGHRIVAIKVTSTEPWAPTWEIRIEGRMSEFLSLGNGHSTAPGPMTKAMAERVARSYKGTVILDGQERTIDFSNAQVTEPLVLPTLDVLRFRFQR
jgi:hypothetical protein